jgi:hypothetical protein
MVELAKRGVKATRDAMKRLDLIGRKVLTGDSTHQQAQSAVGATAEGPIPFQTTEVR